MSIKKTTLLFFLTIMAFQAKPQSKQDLEAIKQLCGCFSVTFNYAETFTNDTTKRFYAKPMNRRGVVEYALPIEESPTKVVIQHLLVIPDGKGTVIKHWREDWEYEKTTWWEYTDTEEWTKIQKPKSEVKGQWVQSVWEVDDMPRYTGSAPWVQINKEIFWLNTTDAPLPRREFTKRNDYNILNRRNRIVVSESGYVHEQDNKKIRRESGKPDSVIAEEKGYNHYIRIGDGDCEGTKTYWTEEEAAFWTLVRKSWENKMANSNKISIKKLVDETPLYAAMDDIQQQELSGDKLQQAIDQLIAKYLTILE